MDQDELLALFDHADRLLKRMESAREMANAAAHQLAQFMSDEVRLPPDAGPARRDTLLDFISVYDTSWVGYIDAREAWREASRRVLAAHEDQPQSHTERSQTDVEA